MGMQRLGHLVICHRFLVRIGRELEVGSQACDFAILNQRRITRNVLRPCRPRVQTSALLGRFNLNVAKQDRAACFHDLAGPNATEDAINKTHAVNNCAGEMFLTCEAGVSIKSRTPAEMLGWGPRG